MTDDVRPGIVAAGVFAQMSGDVAAVQAFVEMAREQGITDQERQRIQELLPSVALADEGHRERLGRVVNILWRERDAPATFAQLFDELEPEDVDKLRDLYDAMPDEARAEFDRRYGRPDLFDGSDL